MELLRTLDLGLIMRFKCGSYFLWHWLERWKPQSIEKEMSYWKETNIQDLIHSPLTRSFWKETNIRASLKLANVMSEFQFPYMVTFKTHRPQTFLHHFGWSEDDSTTQSLQRAGGYCHVMTRGDAGDYIKNLWIYLPPIRMHFVKERIWDRGFKNSLLWHNGSRASPDNQRKFLYLFIGNMTWQNVIDLLLREGRKSFANWAK